MNPAPGTTPVIVGVGQASDPLDSADYRFWSSADLAAAAGRAAIEDAAGSPGRVSTAIDVLAGIRPFELSGPVEPPLGGASNYPRAVCRRIGIDPPRAVLEMVGGQSPQHLVTEFSGRIARGECDAVLITGGEALSTGAHFADRNDRPDFADHTDGPLEDRGAGWDYYLDDNLLTHELFSAPAAYALVDTARRAALGMDPAAYRRAIGELFAPFTEVAAGNPLAAVRRAFTAEELATVTPDNRMVWSPYPRRTIAREKVNLGAAVLLMSQDAARAAGVPRERWVYLHGHADVTDLPLLERPRLDRGTAAVDAVSTALDMAGIGVDDVTTFDLYSCFAAPVFAVLDGLGLRVDDPRRFTVTGGLPFFGGPGNGYSTHAIADTVSGLRAAGGGYGLVGANGGILDKYSVGIYSPDPRPWCGGDPARARALTGPAARVSSPTAQVSGPAARVPDPASRRPVARHAEGSARIESYTVHHGSGGPDRGIMIGSLHADGSRFLAFLSEELTELSVREELVGRDVVVRANGPRNVARPVV